MEGQRPAAVQDQVVIRVEVDFMRAAEPKPARPADLGGSLWTPGDVDRVRVGALQTPEHRVVAAVTMSGGP
jgi:hypothetical protein